MMPTRSGPPRRATSAIPPVALGVVLGALVTLAGCSKPADDTSTELVAEDVGGSIEIPIEDDVQEVRRPRNQLSGVLPSDFPADVPLSLPASLVDFGPESDPWVDLATSRPAAAVSNELIAGLRAKGWTVDSDGGRWIARLDGRTLHLEVTDGTGGATYRIRY